MHGDARILPAEAVSQRGGGVRRPRFHQYCSQSVLLAWVVVVAVTAAGSTRWSPAPRRSLRAMATGTSPISRPSEARRAIQARSLPAASVPALFGTRQLTPRRVAKGRSPLMWFPARSADVWAALTVDESEAVAQHHRGVCTASGCDAAPGGCRRGRKPGQVRRLSAPATVQSYKPRPPHVRKGQRRKISKCRHAVRFGLPRHSRRLRNRSMVFPGQMNIPQRLRTDAVDRRPASLCVWSIILP